MKSIRLFQKSYLDSHLLIKINLLFIDWYLYFYCSNLWSVFYDFFIYISISLIVHSWHHSFKTTFQGFPGGAVVKNPPANSGDTGSIPGPGRSHMPWSNKACEPHLLSLCSRAHEPQLLSPRATATEARAPRARARQQEKPPQWEAHAPQRRGAPAPRN